MALVDALSRQPVDSATSEPYVLDVLDIETENWLTQQSTNFLTGHAQSVDQNILTIKDILLLFYYYYSIK